ncbi:hypothetical protein E3O06_07535 [Cryobacterium glaciale]|uniref:Uncharacterized protein n=1 Tax=Cryobacterium glaciale TaxID=1259145 RepID=A0A4R8UZX1_9MICO|nr:DUF6121 family protein [Cryobacterium glaciale]TFB73674.1 hypothetical protein E3O06_07535 [Cryobacterium glaciale]
MREYRKYAITVAAFSVALYVALIVAAFGVLSLLLNRDVINETDAGALLGPIMVTTAVLALVWVVLSAVLRSPERLAHVPPPPIFMAGAAAYLGYCVSGGVFYSLGAGELFRSVVFIGGEMISPFAIAVAVSGWLIAFLFFVVLLAKPSGSGAPEWPWEKNDDN